MGPGLPGQPKDFIHQTQGSETNMGFDDDPMLTIPGRKTIYRVYFRNQGFVRSTV